jgi:tetratricopeptide (TPR) repeat protein
MVRDCVLRHGAGRGGDDFFTAELEMKQGKMAGWLLGILLVAGFAGVWHLQNRIDAEQKGARVEQDELAVRSGNLVKKMSLEYAPLLAAMYWTRAVQYYGEKHHLRDPNLELLWPLLDIATTLDAQLMPAYRFGSTFLSDSPPRGAGRPDLAVQLLERGINANPEQWRLYQDLGNVYYFDAKDYPKASAAFEEGSKNPHALIWMKVMAAKIAADGESPETSYFLWGQVYESTKDPAVKQNAEDHLKLMRAVLDLKEINGLADEYEKQTGRRATRIGELTQAGLIKGVARDPEGYPYVLGEGGKAELNLDSPLLERLLMEKKK